MQSYILPNLWPDFKKQNLYEAIDNYQKENDDLEKPANSLANSIYF